MNDDQARVLPDGTVRARPRMNRATRPADPAPVREVTMRELSRATSAVIASLRDGERLVITRRGVPVGVVLSPFDALELAGEIPPQPMWPIEVRTALRTVLAKAVGMQPARRIWRIETDRLMHGRN